MSLLGRLVTVAALVVTAVVAPALAAPDGDATSSARAADLRYFNPENIISDDLFYDGDAMSAAQVQSFLSAKGASCVAGEMPCLKNYRQTTADQASDGLCSGYRGATGETAAAIIAKVGASCNINPRVLLVLLQKEQSLVTGTRPSARQYTKATGFACPDTAPCNPAFQGFVSQVYFGARQFQRYRLETWAPYKAFRTQKIQYHPNTACGSTSLYLRNHATAGLYNYTPYQPNRAALDAGYGSGNSCSAYGNRNFWLYYTDWFGSTQSPGGNAIVQRASESGAVTVLGAPTSQVRCGLVGGGCYQTFQKASIYWSPSTGARIVQGSIRSRWGALGWERGALGYPTTDERRAPDGVGRYTHFQRGSIYWTPDTGAHEVLGAIRDKWQSQRWENGPLGYPTSGQICGLRDGGCLQRFQGGTAYWSRASGAHLVVPGVVKDEWALQKWETGPLGYPTSDLACGLRDNGCVQRFLGGAIYSSGTTGTNVVPGAVLATWASGGWENGPLGYPTDNPVCGLARSGCVSAFEHGAIYSSAATEPTVVLDGEMRDAWDAQSAEGGPLGYPTRDRICGLRDSGCLQNFEGGTVYTTAGTGTHSVLDGPIYRAWRAQRWEKGVLGYPTSDVRCDPAEGCVQDFEGGKVVTASETATVAVADPIAGAWDAGGAEDGPLGEPAADLRCDLADGGCVQRFAGGAVYTSLATGTRTMLWDSIYAAWRAQQWEQGPLGYPTSDRRCGLVDDGCLQRFQGGTIYTSPASGTRTVLPGAIYDAWRAQQWERGPLGYPTGDRRCGLTAGGCLQSFQGGTIYTSAAGGTRTVRKGPIADAWRAQRWEQGPLGYPTADQRCGLVDDGCLQRFQGGTIYSSPASGAHAVRPGPIYDTWRAQGWETGSLGYPAGDAVTGRIERTQRFQGGTLVENLSTHRVTVRR